MVTTLSIAHLLASRLAHRLTRTPTAESTADESCIATRRVEALRALRQQAASRRAWIIGLLVLCLALALQLNLAAHFQW